MKSSHVAVAGGVFGAVMIGCFALIGFGSKGEVAATPAPEIIGPEMPAETEPPAPLPVPKPGSAAAGGFGEIARTERLYDPTAVLARSSPSAAAVLATWTLPDANLREYRLHGERLVTVSNSGIRVLNARTGEAAGTGVTVEKDFPDTALSPHGDWAVQPVAAGLKWIDTATGKTTVVPGTAKRSLTGPVAFGPDNGWCAVLGEEAGTPSIFRVRRNGGVERLGTYRPDSTRGRASFIARLYASGEADRMVVERPGEKSPAPRLLAWKPPGPALRPLPPFDANTHESVTRFVLSPDGKRAVMFDADALMVFDLEANRLLLTHKPEGLSIGGAAFTPRGNRIVIADVSRAADGAGEKAQLPGYVWVLDVTAKAAVGGQLQFDDLGIRGTEFRDFVLSDDGSRLLLIETNGKVRLLDSGRAFGSGTLTAPAPAPSVTPPSNPVQSDQADS